MAVRKILAGFTLLALGVCVVASVANAASPCGRKTCSDEVAASGLSGKARSACFQQVITDCNAGACSCTGGSPPCSCVCGDGLCGPSENCSTCPQDCGPCAPTTTTATTTTTSCPTTTIIRLCKSSFSGDCQFGECPPGQSCVDGGLGRCECVGPAPPCGSTTEPFCAEGVCPAGMQCTSLYVPPACSTGCECR